MDHAWHSDSIRECYERLIMPCRPTRVRSGLILASKCSLVLEFQLWPLLVFFTSDFRFDPFLFGSLSAPFAGAVAYVQQTRTAAPLFHVLLQPRRRQMISYR